MKVIFIGDDYYDKSGSQMSSVYQIDNTGTFKRTDWGLITLALERGEEVHICPATKKELKRMDSCLKEIVGWDTITIDSIGRRK